MSVKKIFMTLIIVVACVILGAFILNILLPNVTTALVNTVENMIASATGLSMDFNGDQTAGTAGTTTQSAVITDSNADSLVGGVTGFAGGGGTP